MENDGRNFLGAMSEKVYFRSCPLFVYMIILRFVGAESVVVVVPDLYSYAPIS